MGILVETGEHSMRQWLPLTIGLFALLATPAFSQDATVELDGFRKQTADVLGAFKTWNHHMSISDDEMRTMQDFLHWEFEGPIGFVFDHQVAGTVPVYRVYKQETWSENLIDHHFFTVDKAEADRAVARLGFSDEGICCYIASTQLPGTVPLYRLYSKKRADHFYTASPHERDSAKFNDGYELEGVVGFVWEHPTVLGGKQTQQQDDRCPPDTGTHYDPDTAKQVPNAVLCDGHSLSELGARKAAKMKSLQAQ
jgi:hypothetical protein